MQICDSFETLLEQEDVFFVRAPRVFDEVCELFVRKRRVDEVYLINPVRAQIVYITAGI